MNRLGAALVVVGGSLVVLSASAAGVPRAHIAAAEAIVLEKPEPLEEKGACAEGMVEVEGDYCPVLEQKCLRWKDKPGTVPRRCEEFAPSSGCKTKTVKKHFCIDKYEFPNQAGAKPVVMKSWHEAKASCEAVGKRLCGGSEWTLACEGRERLPYPYGTKRDAEACNIDKPYPMPNQQALASKSKEKREKEAARLWQGEPSGSRAACVSDYGVHDMTGNVDEWVVNESGKPFKGGLKGGYWGPVRDKCRAMTTSHDEGFAYYQVGFRCCSSIAED